MEIYKYKQCLRVPMAMPVGANSTHRMMLASYLGQNTSASITSPLLCERFLFWWWWWSLHVPPEASQRPVRWCWTP